MLAPKLFQNIGVCAPAGLGFLARGQHQAVKQHFTELLWRIYVELTACKLPYLVSKLLNAVVEACAELTQCRSVDHKSDRLHIGKHPTQRKLDIVIKLLHVKLLKLLLGHGLEPVYCLRAVKFGVEIAHADPLQGVVALGGFEKIRRKRSVVHKAVQG